MVDEVVASVEEEEEGDVVGLVVVGFISWAISW